MLKMYFEQSEKVLAVPVIRPFGDDDVEEEERHDFDAYDADDGEGVKQYHLHPSVPESAAKT